MAMRRMLVRAMHPRHRARRGWGVVLLVISLAATFPLDTAVHDLVFRHVVSHEARLLANGFTLLGTAWPGTAVLGALAAVGHRAADPALWRASVGGLAGLALGGVATQVVKHVACRARPGLIDGWGVGPATPAAGAGGFFHWPCLTATRYHAFPSGHATAAFAVAAALTAIAPAGRRVWLLVAACVAVSRVVLNAHFLSDVFAGSLMGWAAGAAGQRLADGLAPRVAALLGRPLGRPA